ncbi:hypothetical protein THAOC_18568 [Thalassiosira oceanica]|uniref:CTP synthase n=1 Tax=Thalassiosira oceanica TaxID=159749 RepID=K0SRP8_THAOC|nr:hypothetical protein THAOC_18568 [Thalassiosira oceanica]|eukprot:EJK61007.1 hypothetical protein THAOC_18568 [Thalassiosira oceanica]
MSAVAAVLLHCTLLLACCLGTASFVQRRTRTPAVPRATRRAHQRYRPGTHHRRLRLCHDDDPRRRSPSALGALTPELETLVADTLEHDRKIVVVTGGVLSGIGKGVTASSIGVLLRGLGYRVTALKIDPYLNVDAGTMSPFEHGEVFVLDDGGECDLDLGNYERFLSVSLTSSSNLSTGKVYQQVIERERVGHYLGKTVQVVPHISDAIQEWILRVAGTPREGRAAPGGVHRRTGRDARRHREHALRRGAPPAPGEPRLQEPVHSARLVGARHGRPGGAEDEADAAQRQVDDADGTPAGLFVLPRFRTAGGLDQVETVTVHVRAGERDNKPPRRVEYIQGAPHDDRAERPLDAPPASTSGTVQEGSGLLVAPRRGAHVDRGERRHRGLEGAGGQHLSVVKALTHAAIATKQRLKIEWIEASSLHDDDPAGSDSWERLRKCDGVVVPGGFGARGLDGKIASIEYVRTSGTPFLGICLGMQSAVIEYTRNVCGIEKANSAEFEDDLKKDEEDAVIFMPEGDRERLGGTMRLGARETVLREGSLARRLYGRERVFERHRHRYEVNPALVERLEESGLEFSGRNGDSSGERMEIVELQQDVHPYFIAAQFHPEFTSRPEAPSPLFLGLLQACQSKAR